MSKINFVKSLGLPALSSMRQMAWRDHAACKGQNPDLFLPEGLHPMGSAQYRESVRIAKSFCKTCAVRRDCLEFGLTQRYGIYGGETSSARDEMRKHNRKLHVVNMIGD